MKKLLSLFICISGFATLSAQWESMGGPYGGFINDLKNNDHFQFAAATGGLFRSENEGETWDQIKVKGKTGFDCLQIGLHKNTVITDIIYAENGTHHRKLYKSDDNGDSWHEISRPNTPRYLTISIIDNGIYLTDYDKLWVSVDGGSSWNLANLNTFVNPVEYLAAYDNKIFIISGTKLFTTTEIQSSFKEIDLPSSLSLSEIYADGDLILGQNINGRICRSEDGGLSWSIPNVAIQGRGVFAKIGSEYYAKGLFTIYKSADAGKTWTSLNSINLSTESDFMIAVGESLIVSFGYTGIQSSHDKGVSFHESSHGIISTSITSLVIHKNKLYAGSDYPGITSYDFSHSSWDTSYLIRTYSDPSDLVSFHDYLFAITDNINILRSADNGTNWINSPTNTSWGHIFLNFYPQNGTLLASGLKSCIYKTQDNGDSWEPYQFNVGGLVICPQVFTQEGDTLFAGQTGAIYFSFNGGSAWDALCGVPVLEKNYSYYSNLYYFNHALFLIETIPFPLQNTQYHNLYVSYDKGLNWQKSSNGIPTIGYPHGVSTLTNFNGILIATLQDRANGVRVSYDNGQTWQVFDEGLSWGAPGKIIFDDTYLYIGSINEGVLRRKISDLYTTSTQPITQTNEISIFPNPSKGNFTLNIAANISRDAKLSITDVSGKVCFIRDIVLNPQTKLDASNLPSGLYFLSIQSGDKFFTGKIVVQH